MGEVVEVWRTSGQLEEAQRLLEMGSVEGYEVN